MLETPKGYNTSAPFVMCTLAHGPRPSDRHEAAHSCGKGHEGCISPRHLTWKTRAENEADKVIHGTLRKGEAINTAKLTEADIPIIRGSSESGVGLARRYGVTPTAISSIRTRKSWAWVT